MKTFSSPRVISVSELVKVEVELHRDFEIWTLGLCFIETLNIIFGLIWILYSVCLVWILYSVCLVEHLVWFYVVFGFCLN